MKYLFLSLASCILVSYNVFCQPKTPIHSDTINKLIQPAANVSPLAIINRYIDLIGGMDRLKEVKTLYIQSEVILKVTNITSVLKRMAPNKEYNTMSIMDLTVLTKTVFDGTNGYKIIDGKKIPFTTEEIKQKQEEHSLFPELYFIENNFALTVEGIEKVNEKDAYKIRAVSPSGNITYRFYDVETGLIVRADIKPVGDPDFYTSIVSNYKPVKGILFPFTIVTTLHDKQQMYIKSTEIKINEGVTEGDFK
ncbi:hypothetical protein [Solitalea canadensis]|uniref:hypothetical protein n=1 Tax=Solitalea canadensis TaxID=995 RepID=UPI00024746E3|nr:hypothetical protein [Solitalea canadensis]